ncbi:MAG TPA: hypothetical protein VKZ59_12315, partial [Acidobacteriota bacterium]|nr:hypothetical protein [Acidobacteriota bacterium]
MSNKTPSDNTSQRRFFAVVIAILLIFTACNDSGDEFTPSISGTVTAEHDYDPISDAVVSWTLKSGDRIGQTFAISESQALSGIQLKLMRMGEPRPLILRIRSEWDGQDLITGRLPAVAVSRFFETWVSFGFPRPIQLESGTYVIQLEVEEGSQSQGYYELYGTASAPTDHPQFNVRYQYLPPWDDGSTRRVARFENPANLDYGTTTKYYADGVALNDDGSTLEAGDFAFRLFSNSSSEPQERILAEDRFSFIEEELLAPLHPPFSRTPQGEPGPGEVVIDDAWSLIYRDNAGALAETYIRDFHSYLRSWGEVTQMVPVPNIDPRTEKAVLIGSPSDFPERGASLERSEAFQVEIT